MDDEKNGFVTLHLLDAAQGHPVQTWKFQDCTRVIIGRSVDADIVLTDPQVSRQHVELKYDDGKWTLHSHGTNGTQIDGTSVTKVSLTDQTVFQLGSSGPTFQFATIIDSVSNLATIEGIDPTVLDFLLIDEALKKDTVDQIAGSEQFQQLKQHVDREKASDRDDVNGNERSGLDDSLPR